MSMYVVVKMSDIKESKTLCMSAYRYMKQCYKCKIFNHYRHKYRLDKALEMLKDRCNPKIDKKYIDLFREKEKLEKRIKEIEDKLWR